MNAVLQGLGKLARQSFAQIFAHHIEAKRQRQTTGIFLPHFTEVHHFAQTHFLVSDLAFVNQQTGVNFTRLHRVDNFIKGHVDMGNALSINFEQQIRRRQPARRADDFAAQICQSIIFFRDDDGAVAFAHAGTGAHDPIMLRHLHERMR
ncbi:MAG: hypothetical protein ALAOOOJD_00632 [bacterium]|nr:hypothetical protein [bacterium]